MYSTFRSYLRFSTLKFCWRRTVIFYIFVHINNIILSKMSKITTPEQYENLYALMSTKRDIAQGFQKRSKEEVQQFWDNVARNLNSLGPPSKDGNTWRKVWVDWKCYIKRKLANNKRERMSTGGGPCRLQPISALEEKVIVLTGLETSTSGIVGARDYGDSVAVDDVTQISQMDISGRSEDVIDDMPSTSRDASQSRERRADKETTSSLLRQQINQQREFYEETKKYNEAAAGKMEEVSTYLRRINRSLETMADTAVKQLHEQKRHNKIKEELVKQKVEIKMKMLQLDPNYKPDG